MGEILTLAVSCFGLGTLTGLWVADRMNPKRDGMPQRIQMLGRTYRLAGVSGPAWLRECNRDDPLTYTYYPVPRTPTD
jgi:hypothetical protein